METAPADPVESGPARWEPEGPVFGGRLRLKGSAVSLYRDDYVGEPVLRPG